MRYPYQVNRPTVLDVRCDPDVPPVPPHATFEQMNDAASALMRGDEDRWGVIKQGGKTKLQEFLPHREQAVTTVLAARHSSQKGGVTDEQ